MKPDKRESRLRAFRFASRTCCILLLIFGATYFATAIMPITLNSAEGPELIRQFNTHLLLLNGLTFAQILVTSLIFGLASKRTHNHPFSRSMALGTLGLGILFAFQVIARSLIVSNATKLLFAGNDMTLPVHPATLDVSGLLIALGLIACSFLLMYGRELRVDSEEIV